MVRSIRTLMVRFGSEGPQFARFIGILPSWYVGGQKRAKFYPRSQ